MEEFVVFNPLHGNVSFVIFPATIAAVANGLASHKRRRLVRGKSTPVNVVSRRSVDLVALTGFSIKEIKETPELHKFIREGKLIVLKDSSDPKPILPPILPDTVKLPPPPVLPPLPPVVAPEPVLAPVVEELDAIEEADLEGVEELIVAELEAMSAEFEVVENLDIEDVEIIVEPPKLDIPFKSDESGNLKEEEIKPKVAKREKAKPSFKKKRS